MQKLRYLSALVVLAGCGMSEEKFWEKYETVYCEEWDACYTGDEQCPFLGIGGGASECEFDEAKAKACLKGEYVCEDLFGPGLEIVESPPECAELYICSTPVGTPADTAAPTESR